MRRIPALRLSHHTPRLPLAVLAALLLSVVGVLQTRPAAAETSWCWGDPIISLNGQHVSIASGVAGDLATVDKAVQRAETTVYIPRGVRGEVVSYTTAVFKDKKVTFVPTASPWQPGQPIPVTVVMSFKAKADLPAQMVVDYPGGQVQAFGTTQGQTSVSFTLPVVLP